MKNIELQEILKLFMRDIEVIAYTSGDEYEIIDVVVEKSGKRLVIVITET